MQVCRLLRTAHCPELLCLQELWEIAIYIDGIFEESEPVHFFTGAGMALSDSSTNAALVLDVIGQLKSSGIFPALKKVTLASKHASLWHVHSVRLTLHTSCLEPF